jgi:predicted transposase YdaD
VDFLKNRRKEVTKNMVLDYTWERREEMIRREEREEGREQGREEGIRLLIKMGREYGMDDVSLLDRLRKELGISLERATEYLEKYGKSLV